MKKICRKCETEKELSDYRKGRTMCKSCENKIRYNQNKERRVSDPEYNKKWKEYDVKRKRKKERENEITGFIQLVRQSVRRSFKRRGYTKNSRTYEILGESWENVRIYFESLFQEGMTWDNHGEWEIDHIIPLSTSKCNEDVIRLCHYTNLQPLWKRDNKLKGGKIL